MEYLISSYTICHVKLYQYFIELGYDFKEDDRIRVFLTDTLDDSEHKINYLYPGISKEGKDSFEVKLNKPIMVIMGNPPYNVHSKNNKPFIMDLMGKYKEGLNEKNIQPLNNDYNKFIRYSHWKIENSRKGIIGIITDNSYLDGLIHRIMRKSLYESFDKIYIVNLHGHQREPDENVFDIKEGVSIIFLVKMEKPLKEKIVKYFSTMKNNILTRNDKFEFLNENNNKSLKWIDLKPTHPDYWFVDWDYNVEKNFNKGWSVINIFNKYKSGIKTHKDELTIHFEKDTLMETVDDIINMDILEFNSKYEKNINEGWYNPSKNDLTKNYKGEKFVRKVLYRPFDSRYTYYTGKTGGFIVRPRTDLMENFIEKENIGLITVRQFIEDKIFNHCFISNLITDIRITTSNRGTGYIFPLYLYLEKSLLETNELNRIPNFTKEFRLYIENIYKNIPTPEEILGYIYSILHSPTYRKKYNTVLKKHFPSVNFVPDKNIFNKLSRIGQNLIDLHLLKVRLSKEELSSLIGKGDFFVNNPYHNESNNQLYINKNQYLDNVESEIYNLEIGGYKVLQTYLKYRKGRRLSLSEISHLKKIIVVLRKTIETMVIIDQETKDWI
ncbi:MAG: hypothetical protein HQ562_02515 [Candidatus Marinimicrobia bacterium]|nr:hypothetical protein [Candidatus Neomarinimicrobiota bacterium]